MIAELECVVLTRNMEAHGLKEGDLGAVVHCYPGGTAFEVEFVAGDGKTIALLTLEADDIRARQPGEILHVRRWGGVATVA
jgi:hypothetical protein